MVVLIASALYSVYCASYLYYSFYGLAVTAVDFSCTLAACHSPQHNSSTLWSSTKQPPLMDHWSLWILFPYTVSLCSFHNGPLWLQLGPCSSRPDICIHHSHNQFYKHTKASLNKATILLHDAETGPNMSNQEMDSLNAMSFLCCTGLELNVTRAKLCIQNESPQEIWNVCLKIWFVQLIM